MRIRPSVVLALGIGYVLGARAGREHYDAIMRQARDVRERPEVQSAAGVVSAQAATIARRVRETLGQPVGTGESLTPHPGSHSSNGVGVGSH